MRCCAAAALDVIARVAARPPREGKHRCLAVAHIAVSLSPPPHAPARTIPVSVHSSRFARTRPVQPRSSHERLRSGGAL